MKIWKCLSSRKAGIIFIIPYFHTFIFSHFHNNFRETDYARSIVPIAR